MTGKLSLYNLKKEHELVMQAEEEGCHKFLYQHAPQNKICCIPMSKLECHFSKIYNTANLTSNDSLKLHALLDNYVSPAPFVPITVDEVKRFIKFSKNKKAKGPNYISNEQMKATSEILSPHLCDMFNMCIETCTIPPVWRESHLKVLYKGKGDRDSANSYRGIALCCNEFKLFGSIITARLSEFIDRFIPVEQFGFVKGRSTIQAVKALFEEVKRALSKKGGRKYAMFIDFKQAFDAVIRMLLLMCLIQFNTIPKELLNILATILDVNFIRVHDGLNLSERIVQSNGLLQGFPFSPPLYNALTHDLPALINAATNNKAKCFMYADDLAISADDLPTLQLSLDTLHTWCISKRVTVNVAKTNLMIFRNGGPIPVGTLSYNNENIEYVNHFKQLGIILQTKASSFHLHVEDRRASAIAAIAGIPRINLLSVVTALKLFDLKIAPIASYGIQLTWDILTTAQLGRLESVKATFLKRVLCVYKKSKSRYVYLLTGAEYFVIELKERFNLPETDAYKKFKSIREQKVKEIDPEFYNTRAMSDPDKSWALPEQKERHVATRFAVHGFHHFLCNNNEFHDVSDKCLCKLCGNACSTYHVIHCASPNVKTVTEYANMKM